MKQLENKERIKESKEVKRTKKKKKSSKQATRRNQSITCSINHLAILQSSFNSNHIQPTSKKQHIHLSDTDLGYYTDTDYKPTNTTKTTHPTIHLGNIGDHLVHDPSRLHLVAASQRDTAHQLVGEGRLEDVHAEPLPEHYVHREGLTEPDTN